MNCFFCQSELIDTFQTGILDCQTCNYQTRYVCSGSLTNPEVWYIHVRVDPYLLEWNLVDYPNKTHVYSGPIYKEDQFIMTLEELLPYSEEAIFNIIHRLLKIKAFI